MSHILEFSFIKVLWRKSSDLNICSYFFQKKKKKVVEDLECYNNTQAISWIIVNIFPLVDGIVFVANAPSNYAMFMACTYR
jgi:hypothetical protein